MHLALNLIIVWESEHHSISNSNTVFFLKWYVGVLGLLGLFLFYGVCLERTCLLSDCACVWKLILVKSHL